MRKISFAATALCILLQTSGSFAQSLPADDTVFRQFGGKEGIAGVMGDFIPLLLADARLRDAFRDVDMDRLAALLGEQFCELTGGPCKYSGKDMKTIHADLKITNAQFNALAEDLQAAMEKHNIPSGAQNKLIAKLAPMQRMVVTK
jgi:hemoglobin